MSVNVFQASETDDVELDECTTLLSEPEQFGENLIQ